MDKRAGDGQPAYVLLNPGFIDDVRRPLLAVCDFLNAPTMVRSGLLLLDMIILLKYRVVLAALPTPRCRQTGATASNFRVLAEVSAASTYM